MGEFFPLGVIIIKSFIYLLIFLFFRTLFLLFPGDDVVRDLHTRRIMCRGVHGIVLEVFVFFRIFSGR